MRYRCAHCRAPLELVDGEVVPCAEHPGGGLEWEPDEVEPVPLESDDDV